MLAFHMFCWPDADEAVVHARERINNYLASLVDAASDWVSGASSNDYTGYDKLIADLAKETFESQVEKGAAWVGTPDQINDQVSGYQKLVGDFEIASLQVNFHDLPLDLAQKSIHLFAAEVMPKFKGAD
jgi:alkanesulfonate monooxygenase SsuD/methylene tetrahydromethanopterin reductase-like flavin-dependent oxidoreductase (luciferase family)